MFGEKDIIGQSTVKTDIKKRIVLPKFTYAEFNDKLLVLEMKDYILLYTLSSFEEKLAKLEEKYKISKKKRKQIERFLYSRIRDIAICEKSRRISLDSVVKEGQKFVCIGCKDHVKLKIK